MKKIEAIIRKTKFEDVKDALLEADIEWFSYYEPSLASSAQAVKGLRGMFFVEQNGHHRR